VKVQVVVLLIVAAIGAALVAALPVDITGGKLRSAADGDLTLDLRVPTGIRFSSISYSVSGSADKTGSIPVSSGPNVITTVSGLRVGTGYAVQLTAARVGAPACTGSGLFDVVAAETTTVTLNLQCPELAADAVGRPAAAGAAANRCPSVASATAIPTADGTRLALTGLGTDPDRGPATLSYRWTSPSATISKGGSAAATLDCSTAGRYVVKLEVYDGACGDALEQTVTCGTARTANAASASDSTRGSDSARGRASDPSAARASVIGGTNRAQGQLGVTSIGSGNFQTTLSAAKTAEGSNGERSSATGATNSSTGTTAVPPGTPNATSCAVCEAGAHEGNMNCPDSKETCDGLVGVTSKDSPVMPGVPKAALCRQIVDCMHSSHCAAPNASGISTPSDCFCGTDVHPNTCFNGGTYADTFGKCRDLIAAGCESTTISEIAMRFFNPQYAAGAAEAVVEICDGNFCAKECL